MITRKVTTKNGGIVTQKICKKSGGKIMHTKNGAHFERIRMYNIFNKRMREYFCIFCNYYHLTSTIGVKDDIPKEYMGLTKKQILDKHTMKRRNRRTMEEE